MNTQFAPFSMALNMCVGMGKNAVFIMAQNMDVETHIKTHPPTRSQTIPAERSILKSISSLTRFLYESGQNIQL